MSQTTFYSPATATLSQKQFFIKFYTKNYCVTKIVAPPSASHASTETELFAFNVKAYPVLEADQLPTAFGLIGILPRYPSVTSPLKSTLWVVLVTAAQFTLQSAGIATAQSDPATLS